VGWGLVAAGATGLAVGTVFILDAKSSADDASGLRPVDADKHARLEDDVQSSERVAWIGFLTGAAAAGAGLWILGSGSDDTPSTARIYAGPQGALVRATW